MPRACPAGRHGAFGRRPFPFVEWPEGCKDANDMLRSDGPQRS